MKRFLTILALLACLNACHGGRNGQPLPHTGDGLVLSDAISNQKVNAFAEDTDGHIWIATSRGLNKYNIHEYHQYFCTDDTQGLPDNQINDVYCGRDGRLWVATVDGAALRTETGEFRRIPYEGNFGNFREILESPDGSILMSNAVSLFRFDPETESLRTVIADYNAYGLPAETWVGDRLYTLYGRNTLRAYNSHDFTLIESMPLPFTAYHICHAGNGELWLSGVGNLHIFDTRSGSWKALPEAIRREKGITGGDVDILFYVDDNTLLLNVIGKGMYCWQRNIDRVLFQNDPGFPYEIPDAEIRTIFKDSRGNLWFGTVDQGYTTSYHYRDGFNNNKHLTAAFDHKTVVSLCRDDANRLWIATMSDGLWMREPGTEQIRRMDVSHLVPDAHIGYLRCGKVFCDTEGELWLLFSDKYQVVRCRYTQGRLQLIDSFFFTHPAAIAQDDQGRIWVGGNSMDLARYDKATRSVVNVPYTDQSDWPFVSDLMLAEPGRMFVAANGTKVLQLNTKTGLVSPVTLSEEEAKACIRRSVLIPNVLFRDSGGDIWVGTLANGLLRHDYQRSITEPVPGAPCSDICAIQEDRQGNIWVATMYGLGKYDRTVNEFVNYYAADGIGGNQFSDRAACLLADGTLIFGGTHGLTVFNPIDARPRRPHQPGAQLETRHHPAPGPERLQHLLRRPGLQRARALPLLLQDGRLRPLLDRRRQQPRGLLRQPSGRQVQFQGAHHQQQPQYRRDGRIPATARPSRLVSLMVGPHPAVDADLGPALLLLLVLPPHPPATGHSRPAHPRRAGAARESTAGKGAGAAPQQDPDELLRQRGPRVPYAADHDCRPCLRAGRIGSRHRP